MTLHRAHRWAEAIEAYSRAMDLAPDYGGLKVQKGYAYCNWQGQIDTLSSLIDTPDSPPSIGRYWVKMFQREPAGALARLPEDSDEIWVSQEQITPQALLSGLPHHLLGDETPAMAAFDSALVSLQEWEEEHPGDWRIHPTLGLAHALVDDTLEAVGRAEEAVASLEPLFEGPSYWQPCEALFSPLYDPIRSHPRFEALVNKHADGREGCGERQRRVPGPHGKDPGCRPDVDLASSVNGPRKVHRSGL